MTSKMRNTRSKNIEAPLRRRFPPDRRAGTKAALDTLIYIYPALSRIYRETAAAT